MNTEPNQETLEGPAVEILDLISSDTQVSQRRMATRVGLSVGLVNLIVKRLIKTGYIKMSALNSKKAQYLLTPKGMAEKSRRSFNYLLETINAFRAIEDRLQRIVQRTYNEGQRDFILVGNNEVADLMEMTLTRLKDPGIRCRRASSALAEPGWMVIDCDQQGAYPADMGISVLKEFLK